MPIDDFNTVVKATVNILGGGGKSARKVENFSSIQLFSKAGSAHTEFSIHLTPDLLNEPLTISEFISAFQQHQGSKIDISFLVNGESAGGFLGIITQVSLQGGSGQLPFVVLSGGSMTILMDGQARTKAFVNKSVVEILNDLMPEYKDHLTLQTDRVRNEDKLEFCAQYNETDFNFIHRIARTSSNWLYCKDDKLFLGRNDQRELELVAGHTLMNYSISFTNQAIASDPILFDYINNDVAVVGSLTDSAVTNSVNLVRETFKTSKDIFPEGKVYLPETQNPEPEIRAYLERTQAKAIAGMGTFRGTVSHPGIMIGNSVSIKDASGKDLGKYIITEVNALFEGNRYRANVAGVPFGNVLPTSYPITYPKAEAQPATVTDIMDPLNLLRVKVFYHWAPEFESPWLRVIYPYAGKDHGHFFVPEIGDAVMVAFEGGNPDKPYVLGSLIRGTEGRGGHPVTKKNTRKFIRSTTGATIGVADDADDDRAVALGLQENGGKLMPKIIIMQKGRETHIKIATHTSIQLSANTISMDAGEIIMNGKKIEIAAGTDGMHVSSKEKISVESDQDASIKTNGDLTLSSIKKSQLTGNLGVEASSSTGEAALKGLKVNAEGQAQATIKAAVVMIN